MKAATLLLHIAASAVFLLVGYAGGLRLLSCWLTQGDAWATELIQNVILQLACCVPVLLPVGSLIGSLAALAQNRFKLSTRAAFTINGIASALAGFIFYVPFQLILMLGAAL